MMLTEDSPLTSGKISLNEASWIGSGQHLGNIFGNFLFALISKHFSLKFSLNLLVLPSLVRMVLLSTQSIIL